MTLSTGKVLPDAMLSKIGENGPETLSLAALAKDKNVVLFGLPGAFTRTCSAAHLPSFIRNVDAFRAAGVDHIICLSVNDPFVMHAWDTSLGASDAGVDMLADGASEFTKAAGLAFSAAALGFIDRCQRFSAYVVNGKVAIMNTESKPGTCDLTAGETLLGQIQQL